MCAADAKEFPSFAHAQVTVTNDLYAHLEHPDVFLFCPTEYCGSRATPSITESQYLKHIGSDLHPNIDIMWTGMYVCKGGSPWDFPEKYSFYSDVIDNINCYEFFSTFRSKGHL